MPGVVPLSGLQIGVETTAGTPVTTTRELYPSPAGYFDPGIRISRHEGAQRGTFSNITHGTVIGHLPTIGYASEPSHGLTFDEIQIIGSQLVAGQTGSGAGADKTWSFSPLQQTHTFDTFTFNVFSNQQAYEIDYGFMTGFSISAGFDDLTQCTMDWVGRSSAKVTVDAVAANNAVKIPSGMWTVKYATAQSGLTGASALANTMRGWTLAVDLPQRPRFYGDGSLEFGQGVAGMNLGGTLTMTWDDTADAVAQYDRYVSQSVSFFRLSAAGPTLGSSTYTVSFDVAVLFDPVTPFASESDGVMENSLVGHIAYDATWDNAIAISGLTNSVATLAAP